MNLGRLVSQAHENRNLSRAPEKRDLCARWFGRKERLISQSRARAFCRLSKKPNNRRDQATRLSGIGARAGEMHRLHHQAADSKTEFAMTKLFASSRCSGHWCQSDEHISCRNGRISCAGGRHLAGPEAPLEGGRWSVMGAMSRHHSCEAGGKLFSAGAMISLIALFRPGGIRVCDGQFLFKTIVLLRSSSWLDHHRRRLLGGILTRAEISGEAD